MPDITLSSLVAEVFERWPETVEVFLRHRMGCPGCYLSRFESLEGALEVYNIPESMFLEFLREIIEKDLEKGN